MNPDFRIKVGMTHHRKTRMLQRAVAASGDQRLGDHGAMCLLRLWEYATEHRIDGVLTNMTPAEIEAEAEWIGERGALIKILRECRWLDRHGKWWKLHQWEEHQPFVAGEPERKRVNSYNAHLRHHKKRPKSQCEWCAGAEPPYATRMRVVSPNTVTATVTATDTGTKKERETTTTRGRAKRGETQPVTPETEGFLRVKVKEMRLNAALMEMSIHEPEDYEQAVRDMTGYSPDEVADIIGDDAIRPHRKDAVA